MAKDSLFPVAPMASRESDLVERGFSRSALRVDIDIAALAGSVIPCRWSVQRTSNYDGGTGTVP